MGTPKSETSSTEPSANPFPKGAASVDNITDPIDQANALRSKADGSSFMPQQDDTPKRSAARADLSVPSMATTAPAGPGAPEAPTAPGAPEPPANVRGCPDGTINDGTGMPKDSGQSKSAM